MKAQIIYWATQAKFTRLVGRLHPAHLHTSALELGAARARIRGRSSIII